MEQENELIMQSNFTLYITSFDKPTNTHITTFFSQNIEISL
jgi:hypothetical protein